MKSRKGRDHLMKEGRGGWFGRELGGVISGEMTRESPFLEYKRRARMRSEATKPSGETCQPPQSFSCSILVANSDPIKYD